MPDDFLGGAADPSLVEEPKKEAGPANFLGGAAEITTEQENEDKKRQAVQDIYEQEAQKHTQAFTQDGKITTPDLAGRLAKEAPWLSPEDQQATTDRFNNSLPTLRKQAQFQRSFDAVKSERAAAIGTDEEAAGRRGVYVLKRYPLAGSLIGLATAGVKYRAAKAMEVGTDTEEDRRTIAHTLLDQQEEAAKTPGLGSKILDTASYLPAFVTEWSMLGGLGGVARQGATEAAASVTKKAGSEFLATAAEKAATGQAMSLTEKVALRGTGSTAEGLARTAARPDVVTTKALQGMTPQAVQGPDGLQMQPGKPIAQAASEALRSQAIENIVFSAGGPFEAKTGQSLLPRILTGTLQGVGSAEISQEMQYWAANAPQGSALHRIATAKTPQEQQEAMSDLAAQVAAFGGMEGLMHGVARVNELRAQAESQAKPKGKKVATADILAAARADFEARKKEWSDWVPKRMEAERADFLERLQGETGLATQGKEAIPPTVPPEAAKTPEVAPQPPPEDAPPVTPPVAEQTPAQGAPVEPQRVVPPEPTSGIPAPEPPAEPKGFPGFIPGAVHKIPLGEGMTSGAVPIPAEKPVKSKGKKAPPVPPDALPPLKPGAPPAFEHFKEPQRLTADELGKRLAEGKEVPGLSPKQISDLQAHHVDGKTLEEIGKARGVSREAVRQSIEKSLQKLSETVEMPGDRGAVEGSHLPVEQKEAARTDLPLTEAGHLAAETDERKTPTVIYERALNRLHEQMKEEIRNAPNGEISPERIEFYLKESSALSDESSAGRRSGPALRRASARAKAEEATRQRSESDAGRATGRGGEPSAPGQASAGQVEGAQASGAAPGTAGHGTGSTGEPITGGPGGQPGPGRGLKEGATHAVATTEFGRLPRVVFWGDKAAAEAEKMRLDNDPSRRATATHYVVSKDFADKEKYLDATKPSAPLPPLPTKQPKKKGRKPSVESDWNEKERKLREDNAITLGQYVKEQGGIKPSSLENDAAREDARGRIGKAMFSEAKGRPIDLIADSLIRDGIISPPPPDKHAPQHLLDLLAEHHTIDPGKQRREAESEAAYHARLQTEKLAARQARIAAFNKPPVEGDAAEHGPAGTPEEVAPGVNFFFGGQPGRQAPNVPAKVPAPVSVPTTQTPLPASLKGRIYNLGRALKSMFNPASVSEASKATGGNLRERMAQQARLEGIAASALYEGKAEFDRTIVAEKDPALRTQKFLAFTDPYESGQHGNLPANQQPIAAEIKRLKDEVTGELMSRGLLNSFIDNHLGHLWKDPRNPQATPDQIAAQVIGKKSLYGAEGFKKERVMPTWRDGIVAGLEPATWNPIVAELARLNEMYKSITGHDAASEEHAKGRLPFVPLGGDGPMGYQRLEGKEGAVFAPGITTDKEYFDKQQMEGLEKFATQNLGATLDRKRGGLGGAVGQQTPGDIKTAFGSPEMILAHEIGHEIDHQYPQLAQSLSAPHTTAELEQLARLRASGQLSPQLQAYLQSPNERMANLIAAYVHAPELLKQVAPQSHAILESFLNNTPKLKDLTTIKPSLELGEREQAKRLAGPQLVGHYWSPEESALLIKRYLEPGIRGNPLYDAAMGVGNNMNKMSLGLSAYHALGTAFNSQITALDVAIRQVLSGKINRSLARNVADVVPFAAVVHDFLVGNKMTKEWNKPGSQGAATAEMLENFMRAGGRARMGSIYGFDAIEKFREAIRQKAGALPIIGRGLLALNEAVSYPIMQQLVPKAKMGAWARMASHELANLGPNASPEQAREVLHRQWQSVENRMGQLTYDNLFWNKTLRDVMHLGVRSVGWNAGDIGEFGGAVADIPSSAKSLLKGKGISSRLSYAIALPIVAGINGALMQYLMTGTGPEEPKDLWFPKTGGKRADGTADRLSMPTYMKDAYALTNRADEGPMRVAENMYHMGAGKTHPLLQSLAESGRNEDWSGTAIRDPKDKITKQAQDEVTHLLSGFVPISVSSELEQKKKGASATAQGLGFLGMTPAPAYITRTSEQQRAIQERQRYLPSPLEKKRKADYLKSKGLK